MSTVEPRPELTTLRQSQDRQYEREGIPMYLALVDETSSRGRPPDTVSRADGADLARRLDAARARLAAHQRDGDLGVAISLLQTVAHEDFDHSQLTTRESA